LRWLTQDGRRNFGLSDPAVFQVVGAFHHRPGKRIYDLYLNDPRLQRSFPLALLPFGQGRFLSWLTTFGRAIYNLTDEQILWFLQESAEDMIRGLSLTYLLNQTWQEQHPLAFTARGWKPFARWLKYTFPEAFWPRPPWRVPGILSRAEQRALEQRCRPRHRNVREKLAGANILSHFCYPSGIRQAALWTKTSLERSGMRTSCRDIPVQLENQTDERIDWLGLEVYPITLLTNAPSPYFVTAYERSGLFRRSDVYRIAYWYWELEKIPEEWLQLAPLIDEIWSPTQFVAAAMRSGMPLPVHQMQPGVGIGEIEQIPRATLGIPDDHFVFLFAFDLHSQIRRKNPHGVIRAFQQAFAPAEKVSLVIKASGGEHSADLAELRHIARNPKIVLIDTRVSRPAAFGLTEMCDCFVSLHRSEGFGLGMAEAMLMGKPVIATNYSGNLDFMNPGNSLLVDYRLVKIPEDFATYAKGNVWAEPSVDHAASYMRQLFENRAAAAALGERAKAEMRQMLSLEAAGQRMLQRMQEITKKR
jgi:glycosyltransferase involved in cell wall biosynthesis